MKAAQASKSCSCGTRSSNRSVSSWTSGICTARSSLLPLTLLRPKLRERRPTPTLHRKSRSGTCVPGPGPGSERADARQLAADHQLVHGLGALVGDDRFEVEGVADRGVFGGDA